MLLGGLQELVGRGWHRGSYRWGRLESLFYPDVNISLPAPGLSPPIYTLLYSSS